MTSHKRVRLDDIVQSLDYGITASAEWRQAGPKFLRITDIKGGSVDWPRVPWCSCSAREASQAALRPGDIVFARTGATTGKSFLLKECPEEAVFASYLIRVRLNEHADPGFVSHFFDSRDYWNQIMQSSRGAAQPGINATVLSALQIPLPPLEEQRRIAAILDKASNLSSHLSIAVQFEDEFNASLFDRLIGDPVVNAKGFPRVRLADLCSNAEDVKCGPFWTQLKQHEFRSAGVPLWGIKHVNRRFDLPASEFLEENTATRLSAYSLEPGDIVMTRKGTVGNCSVYPDSLPSGIMHSDLLRIRLDRAKCLPSFAAYQLHHSADSRRQVELISGGAIMAGINVGRLKEVQIVVPDIAIQKEFDSLFSRGSCSVWQKNQSMIRRSRELIDSLSSSFFLGSQVGSAMI